MRSPPRRSRSVLWRWGPPLVWMAVISAFSTDAFAAEETGVLLVPFLRWLFPGVPAARLDMIHLLVRKVMHVTEFGILACLWYRALGWQGSGWQPSAALTAFLLAAGFSAVDEIHQTFVSSRTGSIRDVGWDTLGTCLGLVARRLRLSVSRRGGEPGIPGTPHVPGSRLSGGV